MKQAKMVVRCGAGVLALAAAAHAQVHQTDVALKVQGGVIVTGRVEAGQPVFPARVFASTLGDSGIPGASFNPGYDSEVGAFPGQVLVGLTIRRALRRWDGQDFDLIPPERMDVIKGATTITTPEVDPPTCQVAGSLTLGLASTSGHLHQHPAYSLLAPASSGVYLLELSAWMGAPGQAASLPFWIVFNQNAAPAEFIAASQWAGLVLPCPADFNRDGILNLGDFGAFQTAFALGDPRADFNRDCALNLGDFGSFQTAFALGCP